MRLIRNMCRTQLLHWKKTFDGKCWCWWRSLSCAVTMWHLVFKRGAVPRNTGVAFLWDILNIHPLLLSSSFTRTHKYIYIYIHTRMSSYCQINFNGRWCWKNKKENFNGRWGRVPSDLERFRQKRIVFIQVKSNPGNFWDVATCLIDCSSSLPLLIYKYNLSFLPEKLLFFLSNFFNVHNYLHEGKILYNILILKITTL